MAKKYVNFLILPKKVKKKMKKTIGFVLATAFVFMQAEMLSAATRSFTMTTNIPAATGVSMEIHGPGGALPSTTALLDFGPMTFDATNNVWIPTNYYIIGVKSANGAGSVDATITYTEGENPNGASGKGLGWHAFATFNKFVPGPFMAGAPEQGVQLELTAHGPRKLLKDLTNEHITSDELGVGTTLVVYLNLATGLIPQPSGTVLFTNADAPGTYSGTITFTATVS